MIGIGLSQILRCFFGELRRSIRRRQPRKEIRRQRAVIEALERPLRPCLEAHLHQAEVQKPLARVIDDIEMHRPRTPQTRERPFGLDAERQAQFADPAGARGPSGLFRGQPREVGLIVKARQRVVGLGLKKCRADRAIGGRQKLGHPAPVHEVGDKRRDEDRRARPRQAGHAKPDHALAKRRGHGLGGGLEPPEKSIGNLAEVQTCPFPRVSLDR